MRLRSTGLGTTELKAEVAELQPKEGYLILVLRTTEPVQWRVRAALAPKDLGNVLRLILRPRIVAYLLSALPKLFSPRPNEANTLTDF